MNGSNWRCVLIGDESLLTHCGEMILHHGHSIAAVVSSSDANRAWARGKGLVALDTPEALHGAAIGDVAYLFSITNLSLLPASLLALPKVAAINFHDGPLPDYAGVHAPVWALLNGETTYGIRWHRMTEAVDAGDILARADFDIDPGETAFSLNVKCFSAAQAAFGGLLARLDGQTPPPVLQAGQPPCRIFRRKDRPVGACALPWADSAEHIDALIRSLDFGPHPNPVGIANTMFGDASVVIGAAQILSSASTSAPGTITATHDNGITVATGSNDILLTRLTDIHGQPIETMPYLVGRRFDTPDAAALKLRSAWDSRRASAEKFWRKALHAFEPLVLPIANETVGASISRTIAGTALSAPHPVATAIAFLARIADKGRVDVGFSAGHDADIDQEVRLRPLSIVVDFGAPMAALDEVLSSHLVEIASRPGFGWDLLLRSPDIPFRHFPVALILTDRPDEAVLPQGTQVALALRDDGSGWTWHYDASAIADDAMAALDESFSAFLSAARTAPATAIGDLTVISARQQALAERLNAVERPGELQCLHRLFSEQAARTPDDKAISYGAETLTYRDVEQRANRLAHHLHKLGVKPDNLVGVFMDRDPMMVVAMIAIHKAGGAYVPLDPAYPQARTAHMVEDSGAQVIITQSRLLDTLPASDAIIVRADADWPAIALYPDTPPAVEVQPENLAYVIYTSGSTGRPKGVMIEHRNVCNFLNGMDAKLAPNGTWLAVTSICFDISVLELFWTLTRGFHVVLAGSDALTGSAVQAVRPLDFSLFYFSADEAAGGSEKYRLLLEGAKFGDTHGFKAIWTPERHFHAFGGLYPNPAVTSAAIAAITDRIEIRGGSVVLPLHHPARVAEEWAVVDNISGGRVGIAFASGWQPDDFLLRPESYADRSKRLVHDIALVQQLWRGEAVRMPGPLGEPVEFRTLPRPLRAELPTWITSAGSVDSFAAAGRAGASVLTHLLGQSLEELVEKLAIYRSERRAAGHDGDGHVTLMLHSFVGPDAEAVRAQVREPMIAYLRTATNLLKQHAWSFPAFRRPDGAAQTSTSGGLETLSASDMDALLEYAFDRYYETSGLFGTPESCLAMIDRVRAAGVDEVACLIDFGVPTDTVLGHLGWLDTLRERAQAAEQADQASLAELIHRHGVTHFQCTPSMVRLLLADAESRAALGQLQHLLVGGEAMPPDMAVALKTLVPGRVTNMYGPTETTIWSSAHELDGASGPVPLGQPLANQRLCIRDSRLGPLPPGIPGEIVIGGKGVARGYLHRADLTEERFPLDPDVSGERLYRTGDIGVLRSDGSTIDYLGRRDNQVKLRGYRIELGEIEALLASMETVREAVVIAHDGGLIAYVSPCQNPEAIERMQALVQRQLPAFMQPSAILSIDDMPRTPNFKIDRAALPAPEAVPLSNAAIAEHEHAQPPANGLEERIVGLWKQVLGPRTIGANDNFFDIGGHSLLAVQLHSLLKTELGRDLPITDIFRFPTVRTLSAHLGGAANEPIAARTGEDRATGRRAAMQRRRESRFAMADKGE